MSNNKPTTKTTRLLRSQPQQDVAKKSKPSTIGPTSTARTALAQQETVKSKPSSKDEEKKKHTTNHATKVGATVRQVATTSKTTKPSIIGEKSTARTSLARQETLKAKPTSKDEEKKKLATNPATKVGATVRQVATTSKTTAPSKYTVAPKPKPTKQGPLKAQHTPELVSKVNKTVKTKTTPIKAAGIMSAVHNVTVSSPPPKRKADVQIDGPPSPIARPSPKRELERPRTSTLLPEEIVILKDPKGSYEVEQRKEEVLKKPSVAFEVKFSEPPKIPHKLSKTKSDSEDSESPNYDDDFESYESDFETGSSSGELSASVASDTTESSEDETEETQYPVTVIHKEDERKLDSGHYDLNSRKQTPPQPFESIDNSLATSEQLDSGISYQSVQTLPNSATYGGSRTFSKQTKRGMELMQKIQLDSITFSLFEAKPILYDAFMRVYGNSNSVQSSTQTQEDRMSTDTQTDESSTRSVWTQFPSHYDATVGRYSELEEVTTNDDHLPSGDIFENSLKAISKFHRNDFNRNFEHKKIVDFEYLNSFLNKTSLVISRIINSNLKNQQLERSKWPELTSGYFSLDTKVLSALKVIRIFSNSRHNLIITVHESLDNIYQSDFSNLLMVWSTTSPDKPIRLLSSWSEVCRAEICSQSANIVVCGLRDGSVAMWDLRETYTFCSKLDGYLTHFAATQSIAPSWGGAGMELLDLGAVVDVKGFRGAAKAFQAKEFTNIQFASLNESGILTIWTLVETAHSEVNQLDRKSNKSKFEYSSPWARVKLIQSAICDLREYLELKHLQMKSDFEMKKSNFERQLFSDELLKELNDTQSVPKMGLQGLRFTNLDAGSDQIFIGTNRNFVIACSKMLKADRFRKIFLNHSQFLFPTALRLLPNEDFLAVGLSNGSVMLINCNLKKVDPDRPESSRPQKAQNRTQSAISIEIGKSCAIQNLIRSERISLDSNNSTPDLQHVGRHSNTDSLRIFDKQVILSGHVLRKHLVQGIEISDDGGKLFALSDGHVRMYDFRLQSDESSPTQTERSLEMSLCREIGGQPYLISLTEDGHVHVHLLI